jgi:hypothetical protein
MNFEEFEEWWNSPQIKEVTLADWKVKEFAEHAWQAATLAERTRCAEVARKMHDYTIPSLTANLGEVYIGNVAKAIEEG